jgi:hypothetical protein
MKSTSADAKLEVLEKRIAAAMAAKRVQKDRIRATEQKEEGREGVSLAERCWRLQSDHQMLN